MSVEESDNSWALKLLERDPDIEDSFLAKHWSKIWAPLIGIAGPTSMNLFLKRPLWAGIHRHVICGVIGFGIGHLLTERDRYVLARRDAILRDYIRLHPEDFPPPGNNKGYVAFGDEQSSNEYSLMTERKKFADIFEAWVPIR